MKLGIGSKCKKKKKSFDEVAEGHSMRLIEGYWGFLSVSL